MANWKYIAGTARDRRAAERARAAAEELDRWIEEGFEPDYETDPHEIELAAMDQRAIDALADTREAAQN